jgi:succinate dehydrogenase flavin-adding protein (antitoxin of CptAB toxin-antitoxin module)
MYMKSALIAFKKLHHLASNRGMKETELMLGHFVASERKWLERHTNNMDELIKFMQEPDPDIFMWLTGQNPLPANRPFDPHSESVGRLVSYWLQQIQVTKCR